MTIIYIIYETILSVLRGPDTLVYYPLAKYFLLVYFLPSTFMVIKLVYNRTPGPLSYQICCIMYESNARWELMYEIDITNNGNCSSFLWPGTCIVSIFHEDVVSFIS